MQIDHVWIPVAGLAAGRAFYEQALAPLGVRLAAELPNRSAAAGGIDNGALGIRPAPPNCYAAYVDRG